MAIDQLGGLFRRITSQQQALAQSQSSPIDLVFSKCNMTSYQCKRLHEMPDSMKQNHLPNYKLYKIRVAHVNEISFSVNAEFHYSILISNCFLITGYNMYCLIHRHYREKFFILHLQMV